MNPIKFEPLRIGRLKLLVVEPRDGAYGHQVLEILLGLHIAAIERMSVYLQRPQHVANEALFDLTCADVRMLRSPVWVTTIRRLSAFVKAVLPRFDRLFLSVSPAADPDDRDPDPASVPDPVPDAQQQILTPAQQRQEARAAIRKQRRSQMKGASPRPSPPLHTFTLDVRERLGRHQLNLRLRRSAEREARQIAARLGLSESTKIVTLHVREGSFGSAVDDRLDRRRVAKIESYFPAMDLLTSRGFTVIRLGDPSMTPVSRPDVIDLATAAERSDTLELWLQFRCAFSIVCDSGPAWFLSAMTNRPSLGINTINIVDNYPLRRDSRYIVKRIFDHEQGRLLSLPEIASEEFKRTKGSKNLTRYEYVDNTPEEIVEAVEEMLDVLAGGRVETDLQRQYRDLVSHLLNSPSGSAKRMVGADGIRLPLIQFLGDGAISHAFAARHWPVGLDSGRAEAAPAGGWDPTMR